MTGIQLFIFGVARSGTNLVARAIGAHPQASIALDPLMPLFRAWRDIVGQQVANRLQYSFTPGRPFQDYYFQPDGVDLLDALLSADARTPLVLTEKLIEVIQERTALEDQQLAEVFADLRGQTVAQIIESTLLIIARQVFSQNRMEPLVAGIKEVWALEFAKSLALCFPQARFIVMHRDPRAILASLMRLMEDDSTQAAHTVSYMRHWRKHAAVADYLASDPVLSPRFLAMRYEDLVAQPESELTIISDFLGLSMHSQMLDPGRGGLWQGNSSFGPIAVGIDPTASERWREHLAPQMVATIEFHCGPEMEYLGYSPDYEPDIDISQIQACVWEAHRYPGKWRSDSGDVEADLTWELLRWRMLDGTDNNPNIKDIRRAFLFESFYNKLKQASIGISYPWNDLL